jgi:Phosphotransferase enzyme family
MRARSVNENPHNRRDQTGELGPPELIETLDELLRGAGGAGRLSREPLKGCRVQRITVDAGPDVRSFIVKRFSNPNIAQRNQMVARRWFPAAGLAHAVPRLLGVAAERDGRRVWHVYEDVGDCTLVTGGTTRDRSRTFRVDPECIEPAVALIARIHARFAGHPVLAECRLHGDDFGSHFFVSAVTDAIRCLDALLSREHERTVAWTGMVCRLLMKMHELRRQQPKRIEALARFGGPETLLHGDLWPINVMVSPAATGHRATLIDWDHVGVGPVAYDLSSFLTHFPRADRQGILNLYLRFMDDAGIRFPAETDWNLLFDTAELARLAITVVWNALSALDDPADWAFEDLERIEQWFDLLAPILPTSPVSEVRS